MDDKEKSMLVQHKHLTKRILESLRSAFIIIFFTLYVIAPLVGLAFDHLSVPSDISFIISFCIGIIFSIFFCTYTIVDEIKAKQEK